ncbi:MAG TPA: hypothetical protein VIH40_13730 [Xanthobacteraceae bacterium]
MTLRHLSFTLAESFGRLVSRSYALVLALAMLIMMLWLTTLATARDRGQYAQVDPAVRAWVKSLATPRSGSAGCCDISDGQPPEAIWDMGGGRYRVMIEGRWHDVPDDALIGEPNRLGYAVVWFRMDGDRPDILCFLPGAGG